MSLPCLLAAAAPRALAASPIPVVEMAALDMEMAVKAGTLVPKAALAAAAAAAAAQQSLGHAIPSS
jgi:hypothetical protein